MRDLTWWQEFNRRFNPLRHLTPEETDRLYAQRTQAPSLIIQEEIELNPEPQNVRLLLAGARGSGKSTELTRAFRMLSQRQSAVVPIYLDIASVLPDNATTFSWLPLVAAALRRTAEEWNAPPPSHDLLLPALETLDIGSDLFSRMMQAVGAVGVWMGPEGQGAAAFAGVAGRAAVQLAELGRLARTALAQVHTDRNDEGVEQLLEALRADLQRITDAAGRPPLLLLDGLDKRPDMDSVLTALRDADLLLDFPAAIVVSGPAQAMFHARFASLTVPGRFQPVPHYNLPVVHKDGTPKNEGVQILLEVFRMRATEGHGDGYLDLFPEELVKQAAVLSSGVVREFLELIRQAGLAARRAGALQVEEGHLHDAVRARRHAYQAALDVDRWRELASLLQTRQRPRADVDELLFTNVVACYQNDHLWIRPNELLVPFVEELGTQASEWS